MLVEAFQKLFSNNVLLILSSLWPTLGSIYIETRFTEDRYSGILTGGSCILFAIGISQMDFSNRILNQEISLAVFLLAALGYFFVHYKKYFDLENEATLIFSGKQIGALELSFIWAYINNIPNIFIILVPLLLIFNGASFALRFIKTDDGDRNDEIIPLVFGIGMILVGLNLLHIF
ncbi:Uncharacterised protein [uncultured archaeon]|nr:Uncharacterised protein [uncultured archaeon]